MLRSLTSILRSLTCHRLAQVYELFHNLCLLSSGEVVYFGAASAALAMFDSAGLQCPNNRNPADHFLHVSTSCMHCCRGIASLSCCTLLQGTFCSLTFGSPR